MQKKGNAIVTLASGEMFKKIHAVTKPSQLAYARRIGAAYVTMGGDTQGWDSSVPDQWMKMKIFQELENYDRIIFLDADIIVHPECPDLTRIVPPTHLGAYNEGTVAGRGDALVKALKDYRISTRRPYLGEYFNSGVMVLSCVHQGLFAMPDEIHNNYWEQSLLNARAFAAHTPMFDIGYKFNRMGLLDNITGESRHASWIIHYAGKCYALREETVEGKTVHTPMIIDVIKDDLKAWDEKRPVQRNILVECEGGLGDVVCAEPVLRYAIETLYKDDPTTRFTLLTHRERVFKHFNYPNVEVTKGTEITGMKKPTIEQYLEKRFGPYTPVARWHTHPPSDHVTRIYYPYSSVHNLDFGMNTMLRDSIPPEEKKIRLEVTNEDAEQVVDMLPKWSIALADKFVAVHPGLGWESKSFPVQYWNEIIERLIAAGLIPVVIGQGIGKLQGVQPVNVPSGPGGGSGGIDLRDKLDLGGMFAAIKLCPVLLSNDSSPIHIAGAFDNWIVMIASCKRPELVFPFRHGHVGYKTKAVYKRLTRDALGNLPTHPEIRSMAELEGNIMDFAPDVDVVLNAVKECIGLNEEDRVKAK